MVPQCNREFLFPAPQPLLRPDSYESTALSSLVEYHENLARKFAVDSPYFEFTDKNHQFVLLKNLEDEITLKVGPIGAFTTEEIAASIQEQTCIYVTEGTMGDSFPKNDRLAVDELLSVMMDGFSPSRVVVIFEKKTESGTKPVAGVQASFGTTNAKLIQTMLNNFVQDNPNNIESSLSTIQALQINQYSAEMIDFIFKYGYLEEEKIACLSRLFRMERESSEQLAINLQGYPWLAMAALAIGVDVVAKIFSYSSDSIKYPEICLYDTHASGVQKKLEDYFGMNLIISPEKIKPTPEVSKSILQHHYRPEDEGGFMGKIRIGYVPTKEYVEKSDIFIKKWLDKNK